MLARNSTRRRGCSTQISASAFRRGQPCVARTSSAAYCAVLAVIPVMCLFGLPSVLTSTGTSTALSLLRIHSTRAAVPAAASCPAVAVLIFPQIFVCVLLSYGTEHIGLCTFANRQNEKEKRNVYLLPTVGRNVSVGTDPVSLYLF